MVPLHKRGNALLKVDPQYNRNLVNLYNLVVIGIETTNQSNCCSGIDEATLALFIDKFKALLSLLCQINERPLLLLLLPHPDSYTLELQL